MRETNSLEAVTSDVYLDPIGYLADLGIEATLVELSESAIPQAA